ncbi:MAG: sigma-70 family RNA polymerase sigma factor [Capnocytophaga sp.]|nr:sigma-70 family RNA polymerase sigma factor [Capnocytophaga sp.]
MKHKAKIKSLTNEELFRFYLEKQDTDLFAELYRRYIPMLYGLCLKYLGNQHDAQDAVMDLYENVSEKVFQYNVQNFHTWLYSVAKNHCLHQLRKRKQTILTDLESVFMENDTFFTLSDEPQSKKEQKALEFCLQALDKKQRNSLQLFYYQDKSYADIVTITGYTLQKVKSYIQNGKRNLKNCIVKRLEM